MAVELTRRKTKWVKSHKPDVIRGTPLSHPASLEAKYVARLTQLVLSMSEQVESQVRRFFREPHAKEYFALDASISSQARIFTNAMMNKFNAQFAALAKPIATAHVNALGRASSSSLHGSLKQLTGGFSLKTTSLAGDIEDVVTASITQNVNLIKTISQQYLNGVQGAVMRSITTGRGLADLIPYLEKQKGISARRARFIARDQTVKAYNAINRSRLDSVGLKKAEWLHTSGSRHPRKSHIAMNGKIFNISEGLYDSEVGRNVNPSELYGCNCRYIPVIDFGDDDD